MKFIRNIPFYIFIIAYWIMALNFLTLSSVFTVRGVLEEADINWRNPGNYILEYVTSWSQIVETTLFGLFLGILFLIVNWISEKLHWDHLNFGRALIYKTGLYMLGSFLIFALVFFILTGSGLVDEKVYATLDFNHNFNSLFLVVLSFVIFNIILLNFIVQSVQKTGKQNLISFLTGKYHRPAVEDRLFMFLDLKSSTTYAERLGNIRYSMMIRDCFHDINHVVLDYDAQIYQYVGDEIVLTWEWDKIQKKSNFIDLFFAFQDALHKKKAKYLDKYGFLPIFKAALHGGKVTVAEVGNIKRDIAFHGDVINTTSRIQKLCNQLEQEFLISSELFERIKVKGAYQFKNMGEHFLRGKAKKVGIYAISNAV